jgi:hypothetical protein
MSKKHRGHAKGDPVTYQTPPAAGDVQMESFLPWTLVRRGLKKQVITPLDAPQESWTRPAVSGRCARWRRTLP